MVSKVFICACVLLLHVIVQWIKGYDISMAICFLNDPTQVLYEDPNLINSLVVKFSIHDRILDIYFHI